MQALIIKHDNSFDYGKLEVTDWNEELTPNSLFFIKNNHSKRRYYLKEIKMLMVKCPSYKGFNVWYKNKLGYDNSKNAKKVWDLLTSYNNDHIKKAHNCTKQLHATNKQ